MPLRDHQPIVIDRFNGMWQRGDDNTPLDHFRDCENLKFVGTSDLATRDGLDISQNVAVPLSNIKRIYNYPTFAANTLLVLTIDDAGIGKIYHVASDVTVYGPILSIDGMTDFAFVPYAGRAYISPFTTYVIGGLNVEKGMQNEFLYVYAGDGTVARKAAGISISGTLAIANGIAGHTDAGFHLFAIISESRSGYLSPPGAATSFTTTATSSVSFGSIPTSGDPNVTRRHLVATKKIVNYNGNPEAYDFFFVPNATIENNTDTFLNNVSFYDQDLLDDSSHLFDNYTEIPAGAALTFYRNRLCLFTTYNDISIGLVSHAGEPEAISQLDGIIVFPPEGNPITNAEDLRDVLYVTKRSKTGSFTDNGDEPSTWPFIMVDNALGSSVHGIATVIDSGSSSVDYLLIATYTGIAMFNGRYLQPELSWKIEDYWRNLNRNEFRKIQIVNAPIQKEIYIVLPNRKLLSGNYSNGMDPKKIRWCPWSYAPGVNTIAIYNIDEVIVGADIQ